MTSFYDTFTTPFGKFSVAFDSDGAVLATAFGSLDALRERFSPGDITRDATRSEQIRRELAEYFAGTRRDFSVKLNASGTAFQHGVWSALREIPVGETRSYGELAAQLGRPGAARAVGRANATNPICLIVPCHRVIGADGALTGFAFGEQLKRKLLDHERKFPVATPPPRRARSAR